MTLPSWANELQRGHWYAISGRSPELDLDPTNPGTQYLQDGDPAADPALNPKRSLRSMARRLLGRYINAPWSGRCGFSSVTEAWNGAVYASRHGESGSMVIFGGGHNDYFGSDVHRFDLATREWHRISDGYTAGSVEDYGSGAVYPTGEYPDGSPLPPHTYAYVQYDPTNNDFLLFKSQQELGPEVKPLAIPHCFNLDQREWRRGPCHPTAYLGAGGWTAWDDRRRILWGNSGDGSSCFLGFSPDGKNPDGSCGRWGEEFAGKLPGMADHCTMAYDSQADRLLVIDHASNKLGRLDPGNPALPLEYLPSSGQPPLSPYAALEYSPRLQSLVYYSASNGADIWRIRPEPSQGKEPARHDARKQTTVWSACHWESLLEPASRLNPIDDATEHTRHASHPEHTFGRFRIASFAEMDLGLLVRHVDSPVYVIRLA